MGAIDGASELRRAPAVAATAPSAFDEAAAADGPPEFVAVTLQRINRLASPAPIVYVEDVAEAMFAQPVDPFAESCHWYAKVATDPAMFAQVPVVEEIT